MLSIAIGDALPTDGINDVLADGVNDVMEEIKLGCHGGVRMGSVRGRVPHVTTCSTT